MAPGLGVCAAGSCRILEISIFLVPVTCGGATGDGLGMSHPVLSTKCGGLGWFHLLLTYLLPISWFCCLNSSQTYSQWDSLGLGRNLLFLEDPFKSDTLCHFQIFLAPSRNSVVKSRKCSSLSPIPSAHPRQTSLCERRTGNIPMDLCWSRC